MRARAVLVELGAAGRGCLRVRPRSAPVAPGLDGADEGLIPLGDLGGALVADLARLDAHRGVRKASPAGGSPSSAARAAPPLRRAQPVERDTHIPCRDACDADVRSAVARNNLGLLLLDGKGRPDEAMAVFAEGLEIDPDDPELLVNCGVAAADLGAIPTAIKLFAAALEASPSHERARQNLAACVAMG